MGLSVQERAELVGTFRWVEVRLMRILAQWVPSTPEMEIKVLFGRHLWNCAQHADALGRRAFELRAPLHYTLPPVPAYQQYLDEVGALQPTSDRLTAFFDAVCPALVERYHRYLAATDALMDEPTVRILENAVHNYTRMRAEKDQSASCVALAPSTVSVQSWLGRDQDIAPIVVHGPESSRSRGQRP